MMKIVVKRTYFKKRFTIGYVQVWLSGDYESRFLPKQTSPCYWGIGETLEPRAIPWKRNRLRGEYAGLYFRGRTAIPEGTYRVVLMDSLTYKRKMPVVLGVHRFRNVVLRTGAKVSHTRGDLLVGQLRKSRGAHPSDAPRLVKSRETFKLLYKLIKEAIGHGESVWLEVRSPKQWTL